MFPLTKKYTYTMWKKFSTNNCGKGTLHSSKNMHYLVSLIFYIMFKSFCLCIHCTAVHVQGFNSFQVLHCIWATRCKCDKPQYRVIYRSLELQTVDTQVSCRLIWKWLICTVQWLKKKKKRNSTAILLQSHHIRMKHNIGITLV